MHTPVGIDVFTFVQVWKDDELFSGTGAGTAIPVMRQRIAPGDGSVGWLSWAGLAGPAHLAGC
eukprot:9678259-Karenia_brevis.AAC.1